MNVKEFVREQINKGETQHSIAEKCGFSQGLVYKILNTSAPVSMNTCLKIARAYHLPVDAFIDGTKTTSDYPHGTDKFKQFAATVTPDKPPTISEQLENFGDDVKLVAASLEMRVKGQTKEDREAFIQNIMEQIWGGKK